MAVVDVAYAAGTARLAAIRSGLGQRTLCAHPNFSKIQISRAEMSI